MRHPGPQDRFAKARVLVVGDVILDRYVYGDVRRVSPEAPVPVVHVRSELATLGGCANVVANVASLGACSMVVGVTGDDADAAQCRALMDALSPAPTVRMVADATRRTSVKTRFIAGTQQMLRADREDIHPISPATGDAVLREVQALVGQCAVVVISDYLKGVLTDRVLAGVFAAAQAAGKPVIVDPKRRDLSAYRGASVIKPNRAELADATGIACDSDDGCAQAAAIAIEATGAAVLLTRSELGMSLFRKNEPPVHIRAARREVFDVSGAGDTAMAAFASGIGIGMPMPEAMALANTAASIVVGKRGTATVSTDEIAHAATDGIPPHEREVTRERAAEVAKAWRERGLRVGFTNGCFDIIHAGHIALLDRAAQGCDRLIVALNTDASVRRLKGPTRPVQPEASRARVLASLNFVDLVVLFDEETPLELIRLLEPDVLVKGADYREDQVVGADIVKQKGGTVLLVDLVEGLSTTKAIERARVTTAGAG